MDTRACFSPPDLTSEHSTTTHPGTPSGAPDISPDTPSAHPHGQRTLSPCAALAFAQPGSGPWAAVLPSHLCSRLHVGARSSVPSTAVAISLAPLPASCRVRPELPTPNPAPETSFNSSSFPRCLHPHGTVPGYKNIHLFFASCTARGRTAEMAVPRLGHAPGLSGPSSASLHAGRRPVG